METVGDQLAAMKLLQPQLDAINQARKQLTAVEAFTQQIPNFSEIYSQHFERIQRAIEETRDTREKFGLIMLEVGWPPPNELTLKGERKIVELYEEEGAEAVERALEEQLPEVYDEETLDTLVERWRNRQLLDDRIPILEQAVEAHTKGLYYLSIPAIYAQIEGTVVDGFGHTGWLSGYDDYVEELLDTNEWWTDDQIIRELILDEVLADFKHGDPLPSEMSRHAILHGADVNYGTSTNSLRAILLFDKVQEAFRLVSTPNGSCYHRYGCPTISGLGPEREVYGSLTEVPLDGLDPCGRCDPRTP